MNLYEINNAIEEVINNGFSIDNETGEVLFEPSDLDSLNEQFDEKADNIACYIKDIDALNDSISNEIKALQERKKQNESKIEKLKSYLTDVLAQRNMKKFESARNKITFKKSQSVNVIDDDKISADYFITDIVSKLDKKTLLADLKAGKEVDGCSLLTKNNMILK